MKRVLLGLCDAVAGIIRGAATGSLLIALCIGRMPYPLVESAIRR